MPTKRNKKLIVKNAIKFVSFIFPQTTNKTLSICFKRLIRTKKFEKFEQCANIPTALMNHHGYHGNCYQRFTKTLDRLEEVEQTSSSGMNRRSLTAANKWNDGVLFNKECIFSNKMGRMKVRMQGVRATEGLSYFEFGCGTKTLNC